MTGIVTLHPQYELPAGRYLLDGEGRLHPERYRGFIKAVAVVRVRAMRKAAIKLDPNPPRREDKPLRSTGRKPAQATQEHVEPYDDETWLEFLDRLGTVKARREAGEVVVSKPKTAGFNGARLAAAFRAKRLREAQR